MSGDAEREARKFGTDAPGRPTDEFVIHAFAEGARWLWPDSRDPGWHVTFRRWLAAHDAAIRAEAARDAFIAGWMGRSQNVGKPYVLPEDAWHAYRAAQPTEDRS